MIAGFYAWRSRRFDKPNAVLLVNVLSQCPMTLSRYLEISYSGFEAIDRQCNMANARPPIFHEVLFERREDQRTNHLKRATALKNTIFVSSSMSYPDIVNKILHKCTSAMG